MVTAAMAQELVDTRSAAGLSSSLSAALGDLRFRTPPTRPVHVSDGWADGGTVIATPARRPNPTHVGRMRLFARPPWHVRANQ